MVTSDTQPPDTEKRDVLEPLGDRIVVTLEKVDERATNARRIILPTEPWRMWAIGRIVAIAEGMKVDTHVVDGNVMIRYGQRIKPWRGPVDASGAGRYPMPPVKVGDYVVFSRWAANIEVEVNGEKFLVIRDTDLHGVVEDYQPSDPTHTQSTLGA